MSPSCSGLLRQAKTKESGKGLFNHLSIISPTARGALWRQAKGDQTHHSAATVF